MSVKNIRSAKIVEDGKEVKKTAKSQDHSHRGDNRSVRRRKACQALSGKPNASCINKECKLRIKGCTGYEGCPGYKTL